MKNITVRVTEKVEVVKQFEVPYYYRHDASSDEDYGSYLVFGKLDEWGHSSISVSRDPANGRVRSLCLELDPGKPEVMFKKYSCYLEPRYASTEEAYTSTLELLKTFPG